MPASDVCPGCGLVLPPPAAPTGTAPPGAAAGCWSVLLEVSAFESEHPALLAGHQLLVDAYGAQHAPVDSIRLPYSLVGLLLALEEDWSGAAVRALHGRMGKPQPHWPAFTRPPTLGERTILDVVEAGARAASEPGHEAGLRSWAADVWTAWSDQRDEVRRLAARFR